MLLSDQYPSWFRVAHEGTLQSSGQNPSYRQKLQQFACSVAMQAASLRPHLDVVQEAHRPQIILRWQAWARPPVLEQLEKKG